MLYKKNIIFNIKNLKLYERKTDAYKDKLKLTFYIRKTYSGSIKHWNLYVFM